MDILKNIPMTHWDSPIDNKTSEEAVHALEHGKIIFLPGLNFSLNEDEIQLLSPTLTSQKRKNISFNPLTLDVQGDMSTAEQHIQLNHLMQRYSQKSLGLVNILFPGYQQKIIPGRASLRTVEISGRNSSYKKDDSRLHVDSFSSTPVNGRRILRVFSNINQNGVARIWQTGESFKTVAMRFIPQIQSISAIEQHLLRLFKITKTVRSAYDHFMLNIHNKMKKDMAYQESVIKTTLTLPPQSSWIVYTDQVSHAAISGVGVLEQTFYLPPTALHYPETSPLHILEELLKQPLVFKHKQAGSTA